MRFSKVKAVRIPKGSAARIRSKELIRWEKYPIIARYVSLGDSIAAGHTINSDWDKNYGERSQYGVNGNDHTKIVSGCYTDLIHKDLIEKHGGGRIAVTSFARSGDTVADLVAKLDHDVVKNAIAKANYVTVCIGANDVLQPAVSRLEEYINAGEAALQNMTAIVNANLATLAEGNNANSYLALFRKLTAINPNAKYAFTSIYNPYKYLWIDEGRNGFFAPLLATIPNMDMFGVDIDGAIKDALLDQEAVRILYNRVNNLGSWAETNVTNLNNVLRNAVSAFGSANFVVTETKTMFEAYPDRPVQADVHYNDLVSVEYTRGYDSMQMDWGRLYEPNGGAVSFWTRLVTAHGLDLVSMANELVPLIVERVIVPDVDPHPEEYGHIVLKQAFGTALGL